MLDLIDEEKLKRGKIDCNEVGFGYDAASDGGKSNSEDESAE